MLSTGELFHKINWQLHLGSKISVLVLSLVCHFIFPIFISCLLIWSIHTYFIFSKVVLQSLWKNFPEFLNFQGFSKKNLRTSALSNLSQSIDNLINAHLECIRERCSALVLLLPKHLFFLHWKIADCLFVGCSSWVFFYSSDPFLSDLVLCLT